jgi:histidinol-phosphatase (PHP family)
MLFDTHIHTQISVDSDMKAEEAIAAANRQRLGLCFTEHVDFEADFDECCIADLSKYFSDYESLRSPELLLGIEIGLTINTRGVARKFVDDDRIDFLIGSVHVAWGYDLARKGFFDQELPTHEIYRMYLLYVALVLETCEYFDSLGHIDYPSRYSPFSDTNIEYKDFSKEYDAIFDRLLDQKKVIEINTKRFNDPVAKRSLYAIYEAYYKRGGRYITLGSDAHQPYRVGDNISAALTMARSIGLKPVHFMERRMCV